MPYDPLAAPRQWHRDARSATANTMAQTSPIDYVRVTRLAIFFGLVGFWISVIMVIF